MDTDGRMDIDGLGRRLRIPNHHMAAHREHLMSDQVAGGIDPTDEQATAEALDGSELDASNDDYPSDYPPDHALASEEARVPIDTGDVPADSLEERIWREEPDQLPPDDGPGIELVEPHADAGFDPDFADASIGEVGHVPLDDGTSTAEGVEYDRSDQPAEELAVHLLDLVEDDDSAG
jgi:hypothetical protein